jgi:D-sedoheptulose 7-phosphate isomerase
MNNQDSQKGDTIFNMKFSQEFLQSVIGTILRIDCADIEKTVDILFEVRKHGRLFIIGSGGGAGHASHAVCDFRKLCNFEAYTFENLSEITARVNDEGWDTSYLEWLKGSKFNQKDCLMVISVGGGADGISQNIVKALYYAQSMDSKIVGIVGRNGGITKTLADACILIETKEHVTPITEGIQSVIWHLIVSHNKLAINKTVW